MYTLFELLEVNTYIWIKFHDLNEPNPLLNINNKNRLLKEYMTICSEIPVILTSAYPLVEQTVELVTHRRIGGNFLLWFLYILFGVHITSHSTRQRQTPTIPRTTDPVPKGAQWYLVAMVTYG